MFQLGRVEITELVQRDVATGIVREESNVKIIDLLPCELGMESDVGEFAFAKFGTFDARWMQMAHVDACRISDCEQQSFILYDNNGSIMSYSMPIQILRRERRRTVDVGGMAEKIDSVKRSFQG